MLCIYVGDSQLQLQLCSYRSYFSPRTVIFWCSHQHRNQRAECTPDQYNFHRMDIYQPMSQEMKVKDFWSHQLLSQERSCPQSCLDSLHLCQLLFVFPSQPGIQGWGLTLSPKVHCYDISPLTYHSTEPMELQIRLSVPPSSSGWADFCYDSAASSAEYIKLSPRGLSIWGLCTCFRCIPLHIYWQINRRAHAVLLDLINTVFLILIFLSPRLETCTARELCKSTVSNRWPLLINIKREKYRLET